MAAAPQPGPRLTELGAAEIVHDSADARGPYDVVLESTGGADLSVALARLAKRGTLIRFGQASRTPATPDFFAFFDGPESAVIRRIRGKAVLTLS